MTGKNALAAIGLVLAVILGNRPLLADDVLVFAAASLAGALDNALSAYEPAKGGRVRVSYGASSSLARQISNGAPADIYISANETWMDFLATRRMIVSASRVVLVENRLVLVAPKSRPVKVDSLSARNLLGILGRGRMAIGDPDHVPAGIYAKAALESLGLWGAARTKLAPMMDVRAALVMVARGEVPLGIVYETDARASRKVGLVYRFPRQSHPPIRYPAALVAGRDSPLPRSVLQFLSSPRAKAIFADRGFLLQ